MSRATAAYLYGFVPPEASLPDGGLPGVGGQAVRLLDLDSFQAVWSTADGELAEPGALAARAADLGWVAQQGLEHERVVAWFVDHASILPVRLLTLYSTEQALAAAAAEREAEIRVTLDRLRGLREWDLKVSYDAAQLAQHLGNVSAEVSRLDAEIRAATPGRRFLLEKKRAQLERVEVVANARRLAETLLDELKPEVSKVVVVPVPGGTAELPVTLNAALLVEVSREARLAERVAVRARQLAALGLDVRFSGPWAPYRFVESEDERGTAHADTIG